MDQETEVLLKQNQGLPQPIDGQSLKRLLYAGLTWLRTNQQLVNSLNVFPVPDGDTGINMTLTLQAAYDEIINSPEHNFGKMAHAIAHGALMGARGNSGVILSQLWRGFARAVDNIEYLSSELFVKALAESRDTAYKGVVRPVEGTILTVAKDSAAAAAEALETSANLLDILERVVFAANESVEKTPELLAELKKAGVVDAGGKGLFFIFEGMLRYLRDLPLNVAVATAQPLSSMVLQDTLESIEPGQDYEVVIDFRPSTTLDLENYYRGLEKIGTSIQVGEGEGIYRMHIHVPTEKRYDPIDYTMTVGTITKIAIENLIDQIESLSQDPQQKKINIAAIEPNQIAVVSVSPGDGISRVFASLGVAAIVAGGQTMNPSTQDILDAFENLPTDKVIILPNNKNIILAAQSAASLTAKNVIVVPSCSVPEGMAAMLRLVPDGNFEQIAEEMNSALGEVLTGEITTAVRDAEYDSGTAKEGDFIALLNRNLVCSNSTCEQVVLCLLEEAKAADYELITLYYGAEISKPQANQVVDLIRAAYPTLEIELQDGGQSHYHYIIAIE